MSHGFSTVAKLLPQLPRDDLRDVEMQPLVREGDRALARIRRHLAAAPRSAAGMNAAMTPYSKRLPVQVLAEISPVSELAPSRPEGDGGAWKSDHSIG